MELVQLSRGAAPHVLRRRAGVMSFCPRIVTSRASGSRYVDKNSHGNRNFKGNDGGRPPSLGRWAAAVVSGASAAEGSLAERSEAREAAGTYALCGGSRHGHDVQGGVQLLFGKPCRRRSEEADGYYGGSRMVRPSATAFLAILAAFS